METMDYWFLELQLSKFNIDGLIIQLEQLVWENRYYLLFVLIQN